MKSFQILDRDNNPVPINELDKQAAEFWGQQVDSECYANPLANPRSTNWYDQIGWAIAQKDTYYSGWKGVVNYMWNVQNNGKSIIGGQDHKTLDHTTISVSIDVEYQQRQIEYLQPYIDLVNHWAQKGYNIEN